MLEAMVRWQASSQKYLPISRMLGRTSTHGSSVHIRTCRVLGLSKLHVYAHLSMCAHALKSDAPGDPVLPRNNTSQSRGTDEPNVRYSECRCVNSCFDSTSIECFARETILRRLEVSATRTLLKLRAASCITSIAHLHPVNGFLSYRTSDDPGMSM